MTEVHFSFVYTIIYFCLFLGNCIHNQLDCTDAIVGCTSAHSGSCTGDAVCILKLSSQQESKICTNSSFRFLRKILSNKQCDK